MSTVVAAGGFELRVGHYNVLADSLADNLKPWFWYGYSGVAARPLPVYRRDELDELRGEVFGAGRSRTLQNFWAGVLKKYAKVYSVFFDYDIQNAERLERSDRPAEGMERACPAPPPAPPRG